MKVWGVLADTGRPIPPGSAVNLLNAGWTFTTALPLPDGTFTLLSQALAIFFEAPWDQLNRPHHVKIHLCDDDDQPAQVGTPEGLQPLVIEHDIIVPAVPGAPNGTPGLTSFLIELPQGTVIIAKPRGRLVWRVEIAGELTEIGFWVNPPVQAPTIGGLPGSIPPQ